MTQSIRNKGNRNSRGLTFEESPPSKEELISQGHKAAELLMNPVFGIAWSSVIQNLQDDWLTTEPHEREKREGLYWTACGLSRVGSELQALVLKAQELSDEEKDQYNQRFE